jgi:hypothetical protein
MGSEPVPQFGAAELVHRSGFAQHLALRGALRQGQEAHRPQAMSLDELRPGEIAGWCAGSPEPEREAARSRARQRARSPPPA